MAAKKAVELSQVPGKATELEKMYVAAVAARRDAEAKDPEEAFVKGMRALLAAHPDEVEAQLDLALMIMRGFTLPEKKPVAPGSTEAVTILRGLLAKAPEHPGLHHYIIHGFEGSTFAKDAWPSCEKYSQLVTNIPHALHMPGHIYSQTGAWERRREIVFRRRRGTSATGWRRTNYTAMDITGTMSTTWPLRTPSKGATTMPSRRRRSCFSSRRIRRRLRQRMV